jgi:NAD-dependent DNA ligase
MDVNDIQRNISNLEKFKKKDLIDLLIRADNTYFNDGNTILTDDIYDIIKDYIRKKYPKDKYLKRVGADEDNKVKLPYYMGSQNKIRDDDIDIQKFQSKYKGPYVVSDKLDGVSCLIIYNKDKISIFTRGNGTEGQDISHLQSYIKNIPKTIKEEGLAVRGELIISKKNWDLLKEQGTHGANARNIVAGCINSKILNKTVLDKIEFIAYDLYHPKSIISSGLKLLKDNGFDVVWFSILKNMKLQVLSELLQTRRKESNFTIDGIVICDDNNHNIMKGKNPEYSFAFKSIHTHEQVEVVVTDVEWNVSKDKYIKPIVKFNEILLDDVNIKQATGFNAAFIEKHKIGIGSRIVIIRSGNVIPHILEVLSPSASGLPSMPDIQYKWNDTHVDIITTEDRNKEYDIKNILYFMKTLEIDYMGIGNITKIYEAGFDTVKKILNMTYNDLIKIDTFKDKSANKILSAIEKVKEKDCLALMDASNMMGRGFSMKKIKLITDKHPCILQSAKKNRDEALKLKIEDLISIDGIAEKSAELFIENLPKFYEFYDDLGVKCIEKNTPNKIEKNSKIQGKIFVFSGFRNKDLEKYIEEQGGSVKTSVSKNTDYVVVADKIESSKTNKARELGIKIENYKELFPSFQG